MYQNIQEDADELFSLTPRFSLRSINQVSVFVDLTPTYYFLICDYYRRRSISALSTSVMITVNVVAESWWMELSLQIFAAGVARVCGCCVRVCA